MWVIHDVKYEDGFEDLDMGCEYRDTPKMTLVFWAKQLGDR